MDEGKAQRKEHDLAVSATAEDAAGAKWSAAERGYYDDAFIRYCFFAAFPAPSLAIDLFAKQLFEWNQDFIKTVAADQSRILFEGDSDKKVDFSIFCVFGGRDSRK
jgi:hypothetical protein